MGGPSLSAILVRMNISVVGKGGLSSTRLGHFVEPGIRKQRFFVYTLRSSIGLFLEGHHIKGSSLSRCHILLITNGLMHPSALCSSVASVYRCQLFFHPILGLGRLSRSSVIWHGWGKLARTACFIMVSLSSAVGSSDSENHSISKYNMDTSFLSS